MTFHLNNKWSEERLKKWLIHTEKHYGGFVKGVQRYKVSPKDPRSHEALYKIGMQGGDRMAFHDYAKKYAEYLTPILQSRVSSNRSITIVEVGILKGTGLAIWGDLFPGCRLIGLDIDLSFIRKNMKFLRERGAFKGTQPELYEFDQYLENLDYMRGLLKGDSIDICFDDGTHTDVSILSTFESMRPHLAKQFTYFIEDNPDVHKEIRKRHPHLGVEDAGELTVITPNRKKLI